MAGKRGRYLTGIDIGSGSVKVVIGNILADDVIDVLGVGSSDLSQRETLKGTIRDADKLEERLETALRDAEVQAGVEIQDVIVSATSVPVSVQKAHGTAYTTPGDRIVTDAVVHEALSTAHSTPLSPRHSCLHSELRTFFLDDDRVLPHPTGQAATRVTAELLLVVTETPFLETLTSVVHTALGYGPEGVVFAPFADAHAVLSEKEFESGVLLVDIGASVTDFAVVQEDRCLHAGRVTVGCDHVINDLSEAFDIGFSRARGLLKKLHSFGRVRMTPDGRKRGVEVEFTGKTRRIPASSIERVVELRLRELFDVIKNEVVRSDAWSAAKTGVVLCGGGAVLPEIEELAKDVFGRHAQVGALQRVSIGSGQSGDPEECLHTAVGLIRYGARLMEERAATRDFVREFREQMRIVWSAFKRAFRM